MKKSDIVETFAFKLDCEMHYANVGPRELAQLVGVHYNEVYMWLNGTKQPSLEMRKKLAEALGCRYSDELM